MSEQRYVTQDRAFPFVAWLFQETKKLTAVALLGNLKCCQTSQIIYTFVLGSDSMERVGFMLVLVYLY